MCLFPFEVRKGANGDHLTPVALRLGIHETQNWKISTNKTITHLTLIANRSNRRIVRCRVEVRSTPPICETNLVEIVRSSHEGVGAHFPNGWESVGYIGVLRVAGFGEYFVAQ
jgi:hypothetical protein